MRYGQSGVLRAVVDTNVWISALLNPQGTPASIATRLGRGEFECVLSPAMLRELTTVASGPRLRERFGLTAERVLKLLELLNGRSLMIPEPVTVAISRDPRDDMFVAVAVASRADALVTRDDDLKADPQVIRYLEASGVSVVTVRQFEDRLRSDT